MVKQKNQTIAGAVVAILIWFMFIIQNYNSPDFIILLSVVLIGTIGLFIGYKKYQSAKPNGIRLGKLIMAISLLFVIVTMIIVTNIPNLLMRHSLSIYSIPVIIFGLIWVVIIGYMIKKLFRKKEPDIAPATPEAGH